MPSMDHETVTMSLKKEHKNSKGMMKILFVLKVVESYICSFDTDWSAFCKIEILELM